MKIQKILSLSGCALALTGTHSYSDQVIQPAGVVTSAAETAPATEDARLKSAVKSVWVQGLKQPQGMAWLGDTLYVAEYGGGQVSKWSREGKPLGAITGLKSPAWVERMRPTYPGTASNIPPDEIWISERKANRVLRVLKDGTTEPVGTSIEEPLGLASAQIKPSPQGLLSGNSRHESVDVKSLNLFSLFNDKMIAISHTTSRVMLWDGKEWVLHFAPEGDGARYGYRNVVVDTDGTVFLTDEEEGEVLAITPNGRAFSVARGLKDPAGIVIGPDKALYVAEEGAGRVVKLNRDGSATPVADGLGAPRDIEFLDAKTCLVSDKKTGTIWEVVWP